MEEKSKHTSTGTFSGGGQSSGSAQFKATSPSQRDLRKKLDKKLSNASWGWNSFSIWTFKKMNQQMEREGQPLAQDHYNVLVDSLLTRRRGLARTLCAENSSVMKTTGNTPVYNMGKYMVHTPLSWLKSGVNWVTGSNPEDD